MPAKFDPKPAPIATSEDISFAPPSGKAEPAPFERASKYSPSAVEPVAPPPPVELYAPPEEALAPVGVTPSGSGDLPPPLN